MKYNFQQLSESTPYFSTELNYIEFILNSSMSLKISLFEISVINENKPILESEIKPVNAFALSGIGDVMRDYMLYNTVGVQFTTSEFKLRIQSGNSTIFEKTLKVIVHYGSPYLKAEDVVDRQFLMDSALILIPIKDGKIPTVPITSYFKDKTKEYVVNYIEQAKLPHTGSSPYRSLSSGPTFYSNLSLPVYESAFLLTATDVSSKTTISRIMAKLIPYSGGASFIFMNSFGAKEYMYIPGILSKSTKINSNAAGIEGEIQQLDISEEESFSLKVENAPDWLFKNAEALLKSRFVTWIEEQDNADTSWSVYRHKNVRVTELSGSLQHDPLNLSDFTISFKRIDY